MAKSTNISVQNGSGYLIVGETPRADVCRDGMVTRVCTMDADEESSSDPSLIKLKLVEKREIRQQCLEDDWI